MNRSSPTATSQPAQPSRARSVPTQGPMDGARLRNDIARPLDATVAPGAVHTREVTRRPEEERHEE